MPATRCRYRHRVATIPTDVPPSPDERHDGERILPRTEYDGTSSRQASGGLEGSFQGPYVTFQHLEGGSRVRGTPLVQSVMSGVGWRRVDIWSQVQDGCGPHPSSRVNRREAREQVTEATSRSATAVSRFETGPVRFAPDPWSRLKREPGLHPRPRQNPLRRDRRDDGTRRPTYSAVQ